MTPASIRQLATVRRTWSRRCAVPAIALLTCVLTVGPAAARPVDAPARTATPTAVVDTSQTVTVQSAEPEQTLRIPIPDGFTPVRVTGTLTAAAPGAGTVDVIAHGGVVATFAADTAATLDVAVDPADVTDGTLTLGVRLRTAQTDDTSWCSGDPTVRVVLDHVSVALTGTLVPPASVATFFSPAVADVEVVADGDVTVVGLDEAALATAGAIGYRLTAATVRVVSTGAPAATAATPAAVRRAVRLVPGTGPVTTAIAVRADGVVELVLTGDVTQLAAAGRALGSPLVALADSAVTSGLTQSGTAPTALGITLADLGTQKITLTGYGTSTSFTEVKQDAFGGPVSAIALHLVGAATTLPATTVARAAVLWNGVLVDSFVLGEQTTFTRDLTIDGATIQQSNGLQVRLDAASADGACRAGGGLLPVELDVSGVTSTLTGTRGDGGAIGFLRFPQVLGGALPVAFGAGVDRASALSAAGDLVVSLQRAAARQLDVRVVDVAALAASDQSGLVVGATAEDSATFSAPFRLAQFRTVAPADVAFGVGVDAPYAALVAFTNGPRSILLLGAWSPAGGLDATTSTYVRAAGAFAATRGWFGLHDDLVVVQSADGDPVNLATSAVVPQPEVTDTYRGYVGWAIGVIALIVVAGLLGWRARRRARADARRYVEAEAAANAAAEAALRAAADGPADENGSTRPSLP